MTRSLPVAAHPARWNRVFWAFTIGVLPITLIYIGGLRTLQAAVVVASLPLLVVMVIMAIAFVKQIREHP